MGSLKDYKFWLKLFLDKEKNFSYKEYLLSSFGVLGSKIKTFLKTISGTILSFDDGVAKPAVSLIAHFEPVQDLHGYDSPWPAGGGKNLLQNTNVSEIINGVTFTVHDDGTVTANGTASAESDLFIKSGLTLEAGSYVLSGCPTGGSTSTYRIFATNVGSDTGNSLAFTLNETKTVTVKINIKSGTEVTNLLFKPMICLSSAQNPTTFAPYSNVCPISGFTGMDVVVSPTTDAQDGTTYPITFPTEAGEVYGGYVDVTQGKLVVDRAFMLLNNPERWAFASDSTIDFRYDTDVVDRKIFNNSFDGLMCSYAIVDKNNPRNSARWGGAGSDVFGFKGLGLTLEQIKSDAEQGKISIVYELATPITYDLTPQQIALLKGYNNVWNSAGGNNELTYIGTKKGN